VYLTKKKKKKKRGNFVMGRVRTIPEKKKKKKGFWFASTQDIPEEDAILLPLASSSLSALVHLAAIDLDTT
jgi:hypothetical protein